MAASLMACVPMIVIYLIFQKQFIEELQLPAESCRIENCRITAEGKECVKR